MEEGEGTMRDFNRETEAEGGSETESETESESESESDTEAETESEAESVSVSEAAAVADADPVADAAVLGFKDLGFPLLSLSASRGGEGRKRKGA